MLLNIKYYAMVDKIKSKLYAILLTEFILINSHLYVVNSLYKVLSFQQVTSACKLEKTRIKFAI